jgi:uncharacterized protein (DUF849 family)
MSAFFDRVLCQAKASAKALAGFAAAAVAGYAARVGLELGSEAEVGLAALGVALIVYMVRNRPCE